ncbi:hypothetical protein FOA52_011637 [Chlamydomonas sp. UWO 241]|nr:hypothetical protein FOA52_011637 [Chlamydomonas sp. UWO 241]
MARVPGRSLTTTGGMPTSITTGFLKSLIAAAKAERPAAIGVVFDRGRSFRHLLWTELGPLLTAAQAGTVPQVALAAAIDAVRVWVEGRAPTPPSSLPAASDAAATGAASASAAQPPPPLLPPLPRAGWAPQPGAATASPAAAAGVHPAASTTQPGPHAADSATSASLLGAGVGSEQPAAGAAVQSPPELEAELRAVVAAVLQSAGLPQPSELPAEASAYKAGRSPVPPSFAPDMANLMRLLHAMRLEPLTHPLLEADDIMAGLARQASRQGYQVKLLSGDGDLVQLVSDADAITVLNPGVWRAHKSFVLSIPVARGANWFLSGGGRRMDEEEATAAAAERIAAAAEDGTSLPVRLATDVVRFLYGGTGRREPADGGVVSASLLNAKPAVGGIGVEPRGGGVLRVLFTVASDAVADTVVRWRHELRRCVDSTAVFDVLSDREEAQHQALWPAFLAAKVAGKRAQFHRARLVVDGERGCGLANGNTDADGRVALTGVKRTGNGSDVPWQELDEEAVRKSQGMEPWQIRDSKALCGDSSDNVPGVRGVGDVTARTLLKQSGNLDEVYAAIAAAKPAVRTKLEVGRASAYFSRLMCTLAFGLFTRAGMPAATQQMALRGFEMAHVTALLEELEMSRSLAEITACQASFGGEAPNPAYLSTPPPLWDPNAAAAGAAEVAAEAAAEAAQAVAQAEEAAQQARTKRLEGLPRCEPPCGEGAPSQQQQQQQQQQLHAASAANAAATAATAPGDRRGPAPPAASGGGGQPQQLPPWAAAAPLASPPRALCAERLAPGGGRLEELVAQLAQSGALVALMIHPPEAVSGRGRGKEGGAGGGAAARRAAAAASRKGKSKAAAAAAAAEAGGSTAAVDYGTRLLMAWLEGEAAGSYRVRVVLVPAGNPEAMGAAVAAASPLMQDARVPKVVHGAKAWHAALLQQAKGQQPVQLEGVVMDTLLAALLLDPDAVTGMELTCSGVDKLLPRLGGILATFMPPPGASADADVVGPAGSGAAGATGAGAEGGARSVEGVSEAVEGVGATGSGEGAGAVTAAAVAVAVTDAHVLEGRIEWGEGSSSSSSNHSSGGGGGSAPSGGEGGSAVGGGGGGDSAAAAAAVAAAQLVLLGTSLLGHMMHEAPAALKLLQSVEIPLSGILARMEATGILLDPTSIAGYAAEVEAQFKEVEEKCFAAAGETINLNSVPEVSRVLYSVLKLPTRDIKATRGGFSIDKASVTKLAAYEETLPPEQRSGLPSLILQRRHLWTIKSNYLAALSVTPCDTGSRVHTTFVQTGATTGRLACISPNLQGFPAERQPMKRLRSAFTASPGWMLMAADYSQIELRIMAHATQEPGLVRAFREGVDVHASTARRLFGKADGEEVTEVERRLGKATNFGVFYGMGATKLQNDSGLTRQEAPQFIAKVETSHPAVFGFMLETKMACVATGFTQTLYGRRRRFSPDISRDAAFAALTAMRSRDDEEAVRGAAAARALLSAAGRFKARLPSSVAHQVHRSKELIRRPHGLPNENSDTSEALRAMGNAPLQGTGADVMKRAIVLVDVALRNHGLSSRLLLTVHDELVLEVAPGESQAVRALLEEQMGAAAPGFSVPLDICIKEGRTWADVS